MNNPTDRYYLSYGHLYNTRNNSCQDIASGREKNIRHPPAIYGVIDFRGSLNEIPKLIVPETTYLPVKRGNDYTARIQGIKTVYLQRAG